MSEENVSNGAVLTARSMSLFAKAVCAESDDSPSNWACEAIVAELVEHDEGVPMVSFDVARHWQDFMGASWELFEQGALFVVSRLSSRAI